MSVSRTFFFLFVVVAWMDSASAWAAVRVDSTVDAVTVYTSGATVTRTAEVQLPPGETELIFGGLSAAIERQRLQVELGGDGVSLGQIKFNEVQQRDAFDAEVRELQAQIEAVEARIAGLDDSSRTAELKLKFLDGIAQGYAKESWFEGARGNADIGSWRSALQVLDEGSSSARATLRDNARNKRDAQEELSALQRTLEQLQGQRRAATEVVVSVMAEKAVSVPLKLHYFQRSAGWSPQYVAKLDSGQGSVQLQQQAQVRQTTDENWSNVKLTLTTSEPSGAMQAPDVHSEFLDLRDPRVERAAQDSAAAVRKLEASRVMDYVTVSGANAAAPVSVDVGGYTVTYDVPGRVTVTNDRDDESSFELASVAFDADLVTRIVPRESAEAFLVAKFEYGEDLPLYAANMLIYVDQVFVGETWLQTVLPEQEVTLPVGQDRRVEFTVRNQGGSKGESGFIGRRKSELVANLFEITNRRASASVVEVFDRYPTAVNDDVEVSIPREATPPTERDFMDKPGVIVWRKTLEGGASWRISHQYEVSYPADKTLVRRAR